MRAIPAALACLAVLTLAAPARAQQISWHAENAAGNSALALGKYAEAEQLFHRALAL